MMCLILTPSFFLGSTGQGVQQAWTGCSQMNPEMPLLWQRLATSIIEAMHVTGAWNQITNLALSASYGNKPWKDVKRHNFRSLLIGYHGHEGSTDPSRNLDEMTHCGKDGYQACANCSGACYFAWGLPWFGGLSFVSRLWFEEGLTNTPCIQNAPLKLWSQPATYTQPAQLSLSETNLPSVADVNWAVALWQSSRSSSLCQGTRLLLSTPTQSAPVRNRLSSVGFDPIFTDAQHKTCHGVGWRCKSRILADQFVWKHVVILHRFATTSNQLIASCNLYSGWVCAR